MNLKALFQLTCMLFLAGCSIEENAGITVTGNSSAIAGTVTIEDSSKVISLQRFSANKPQIQMDSLWIVLLDSNMERLDSLHPENAGGYEFDSLASGDYHIRVRNKGVVVCEAAVSLKEEERRILNLVVYTVSPVGDSSSNQAYSSSQIASSSAFEPYEGIVVESQSTIWNSQYIKNVEHVRIPSQLFALQTDTTHGAWATDSLGGKWFSFNDEGADLHSSITPVPGTTVLNMEMKTPVIELEVSLDPDIRAYAGIGFYWQQDEQSTISLLQHQGMCFSYTSTDTVIVKLKQNELNSQYQFILAPDTINATSSKCLAFGELSLPEWSTESFALDLHHQLAVEFLFSHENIPADRRTIFFRLERMSFGQGVW